MELLGQLKAMAPDYPGAPPARAQMLDYQLVALYLLGRQFNRPGCRMLEIGTGQGASAFLLSKSAPSARITTLTTSAAEIAIAERLWRAHGCGNVTAVLAASWDFLLTDTERYDLIFVDGDHNRIARDLPWFNRLRTGGLFLCHDYSRLASATVWAELNLMSEALARPFDVLLVDEREIGMAGFYRAAGEEVAA